LARAATFAGQQLLRLFARFSKAAKHRPIHLELPDKVAKDQLMNWVEKTLKPYTIY